MYYVNLCSITTAVKMVACLAVHRDFKNMPLYFAW